MRLAAIPLLTAMCAGCCTTPAPDAHLVCGAGAVAAEELMRTACGIVP